MIESMTDRLFPNVDMQLLKAQLVFEMTVRHNGQLLQLVSEGVLAQSQDAFCDWVEKCKNAMERMKSEQEGLL